MLNRANTEPFGHNGKGIPKGEERRIETCSGAADVWGRLSGAEQALVQGGSDRKWRR